MMRIYKRQTVEEYLSAGGTIQRNNDPKTPSKHPVLWNQDRFYTTQRWRELRYQAFLKYGNICQCCGRSPDNSCIQLQVDHIKPRKSFPELQNKLSNLQILCSDCNSGKTNKFFTDWRGKATKEHPEEHY
ncbi:MAG: HNH endonuclease [bacterium]|nr:HNH endonuclease [bacterium]